MRWRILEITINRLLRDGYAPANRRKSKNGDDMFSQTSKTGKCANTIKAVSSSYTECITLIEKREI